MTAYHNFTVFIYVSGKITLVVHFTLKFNKTNNI